MLRRCATLNMKGAEQAYWMVRLMHSGKDPSVLGYVPDTTPRAFRYAVPLTGPSNDDSGRLIGHSDFGVTSSDVDDPTNRLVATHEGRRRRPGREVDNGSVGLRGASNDRRG